MAVVLDYCATCSPCGVVRVPATNAGLSTVTYPGTCGGILSLSIQMTPITSAPMSVTIGGSASPALTDQGGGIWDVSLSGVQVCAGTDPDVVITDYFGNSFTVTSLHSCVNCNNCSGAATETFAGVLTKASCLITNLSFASATTWWVMGTGNVGYISYCGTARSSFNGLFIVPSSMSCFTAPGTPCDLQIWSPSGGATPTVFCP